MIEKKVDEAVKSALKWIEEHPQADKDEFEAKRKELEQLWTPIITAAYGQAGGGGGMPGGMPNMGDFGAQGDPNGGDASGPQIDEVD